MSPDLLPQPREVDLDEARTTVREPEVVRVTGLPAQGYRIGIADDAVTIEAADAAGEFYAAATLAQLRHTHEGALPIGSITDWPDVPVRAVLLDIARDKVPTMETLFALVDRLASWKVNQLHLYSEHTFAFVAHEDVWRDASPMTGAEIRALDRYCAARHVELVPNQNCLGHMERWLRHPRYAPLALAPDGRIEHGLHHPATTIDPTKPESLALVRSLLAELLGNFTSRRVHVGLDEPWELPAERIDDYLAWLGALRDLPELSGREMLVWGDVLAGRPGPIADLPPGVTVCEWGYDDHFPFAARGEVLAAAGQPFWTCPGTSSWLSILGRVTNMRGNCTQAVDAALTYGGAGVLNTDWGDSGHLQYLPISDPGLAYGAAVSWCLRTNADLDLARALSTHCYGDPTGELGAAVVGLGDVHRLTTVQLDNVAANVLHLYYPQIDFRFGRFAEYRPDEFEAILAALDTNERRIERSAPRREDGDLVRAELQNAIALVRVLARDALARLAGDGTLASIPGTERRTLADALDDIVAEHRRLWHARNRPGGYPDSEGWLTRLRTAYETGRPGTGPSR